MKRDFHLYNEATGWTLHAAGLCGRSRADVAANLSDAVKRHVILPLQLVQDDALNIRVTSGKLSAQEEAEWVARFTGKLSIPCGILALEGGFGETAEPEFICTLEMVPGDYRVEIYTFFWGVNGEYCLPAVEPPEPVGAWFRRTRPEKRFPALLKLHLGENAEEDPGYEEYWDNFYESDRYEEIEAPDLIDFLVRLTPWRAEDAVDLPALKEGWIPIEHNVRRPELCPLGIKARLG